MWFFELGISVLFHIIILTQYKLLMEYVNGIIGLQTLYKYKKTISLLQLYEVVHSQHN